MLHNKANQLARILADARIAPVICSVKQTIYGINSHSENHPDRPQLAEQRLSIDELNPK
jgi:hypothetical protein